MEGFHLVFCLGGNVDIVSLKRVMGSHSLLLRDMELPSQIISNSSVSSTTSGGQSPTTSHMRKPPTHYM